MLELREKIIEKGRASAISYILGIKSELGVTLRRAYKENDRETLQSCVKDLQALQRRMKKFIDIYTRYFTTDNMAYGVEVNHLFLGGQVARYVYIEKAVKAYLNEGKKIEELETETLMPSLIPQPGEDKCLQFNYRWLLTYCWL